MAKIKGGMTSEQIKAYVTSAGPEVVASYFMSKNRMLEQLKAAEAEGQTALAGFLFAHAEIANEIGRRFKQGK